jgi:hypothetical protein
LDLPTQSQKKNSGRIFDIFVPPKGIFSMFRRPQISGPSLQEVAFAPGNARYFRFTSLQAIWGSGWTSAAEVSVLPADASCD